MTQKITTAALVGIDAVPVTVEADIANGMPRMFIVGLPDAAVSEAQERVRSAIRNTPGVDFPMQRITVNLAPADVRKEGSGFDCAIALAIIGVHMNLGSYDEHTCVLGELSLDGTLRPTNGILPIVSSLLQHKITSFIVPEMNAEEASLVSNVDVFPARSLREVMLHVTGRKKIHPYVRSPRHIEPLLPGTDLRDIAGQHQAKRCLEIAASGGHNVLFSGPPGSGKTLLARSITGILPLLDQQEALEVTRIFSVAGLLDPANPLMQQRPFRSPHHTASPAAIVGGGSNPRPGEITLAHRGVLFLDEFPEFPRAVLESLRQPLEDGFVNISRAAMSMRFPSRFMLVASQNPCPCGYAGDPGHRCRCTPSQLERYRRRVSGPLLDRIDLHCLVPRQPTTALEQTGKAESSLAVRKRILAAREVQQRRFYGLSTVVNGEMKLDELRRFCMLEEVAADLLRTASESMQLSGRAYHRVIRVARTIADLGGSETIKSGHIAEALQYRQRVG